MGVNFNLGRAFSKKPPFAFVNWSLGGGDFPVTDSASEWKDVNYRAGCYPVTHFIEAAALCLGLKKVRSGEGPLLCERQLGFPDRMCQGQELTLRLTHQPGVAA